MKRKGIAAIAAVLGLGALGMAFFPLGTPVPPVPVQSGLVIEADDMAAVLSTLDLKQVEIIHE